MELIYLWVEDYKNIHKQGFNFSPRFTCKYDEEKNELTIDENDNYIENFFGDNINVTAIVGKNGSGKSSILDLITELESTFSTNISLFSIIYKNGKLILHHLNMNKVNITTLYKNIIQEEFPKYKKDFPTSAIKGSDIPLQNINFITLSPMLSNLHNRYNRPYLHCIYNTKKDDEKKSFNYDTFFDDIFFDIPEQLKDETVRELFNIQCVPDRVYFWFSSANNNLDTERYSDLLKYKISSHSDDTNSYEIPLKNLTPNLKRTIRELQNTIKNNACTFRLYFKLQNIQETEIHFSGGELALFFYIKSLKMIKENSLIMIDECELYLHPEWQKYFLTFLTKFVKKNTQVIITTHSPFMLSDLTKQNIIFLDKDKNGKCKVVDGLKEKKQTFGANIHTLLSDSFFMEDGLMGEFAKGKIDEVIKLLNRDSLDKKELKYCEQIISIIGEPIVKNQLQRVLDSKRLKKVDEIDAIKKSIEAMQKRLDELEK